MRVGLLAIVAISMSCITISCGRDQVVSDPQGNVYATAMVGRQEWMAGNLLLDVGEGCYCYDNDATLCAEMGRLYTWAAALEAAQQIDGWHLPSREEWQELIAYCGGDSAGYSTIVSDSIGFNPQWSGVRTSVGAFKARGLNTVNYWSATTADTNSTYAYSVAIMSNLQIISPHNYPKGNACSVRLIRDR